jgi:hypothetical protein
MSYPDSVTEALSSAEASPGPVHTLGLQDLELVKNSDPRSAILSIDGENADQSAGSCWRKSSQHSILMSAGLVSTGLAFRHLTECGDRPLVNR